MKRALISLLLIGAIVFGAFTYLSDNKSVEDSEFPTISEEEAEQNSQAANDKKDEILEQENSVDNPDETKDPEQNTSSPKSVTPVITQAQYSGGIVTIKAFVDSGTGGSCILEMTKGASTITKPAKVTFSGTHYDCETIKFSASDEGMSKGTWEVRMRFESSTEKGISDPWPGGVTI